MVRHLTAIVLLPLFLLSFVQPASARGDDDTRRWAVDGTIGTAGPLRMDIARPGIASSLPSMREGFSTGVHVEYFLPDAPFSLKAGYEHEEINFVNQDISSDLNSLSLGGRYYPLPRHWIFQPFIGGDILFNTGGVNDNQQMESYSSSPARSSYRREARLRLPRLSMAPVAGVELQLLSSVYLQAQYSYRWGIGSHVDIVSADISGNGPVYYDHGTFHRHVLTIGLKLTFPFHFTTRDGKGMIQSFIESLLSAN